MILPITLSIFSFPFTVNKHTNYGSPRCMGLSTDASSFAGGNISGFRQSAKHWQISPLFFLQNNKVTLCKCHCQSWAAVFCITQSPTKQDMSQKKERERADREPVKGFLPLLQVQQSKLMQQLIYVSQTIFFFFLLCRRKIEKLKTSTQTLLYKILPDVWEKQLSFLF